MKNATLLSMLALGIAGVTFGGCGDDDDDGPRSSTGGDSNGGAVTGGTATGGVNTGGTTGGVSTGGGTTGGAATGGAGGGEGGTIADGGEGGTGAEDDTLTFSFDSDLDGFSLSGVSAGEPFGAGGAGGGSVGGAGGAWVGLVEGDVDLSHVDADGAGALQLSTTFSGIGQQVRVCHGLDSLVGAQEVTVRVRKTEGGTSGIFQLHIQDSGAAEYPWTSLGGLSDTFEDIVIDVSDTVWTENPTWAQVCIVLDSGSTGADETTTVQIDSLSISYAATTGGGGAGGVMNGGGGGGGIMGSAGEGGMMTAGGAGGSTMPTCTPEPQGPFQFATDMDGWTIDSSQAPGSSAGTQTTTAGTVCSDDGCVELHLDFDGEGAGEYIGMNLNLDPVQCLDTLTLTINAEATLGGDGNAILQVYAQGNTDGWAETQIPVNGIDAGVPITIDIPAGFDGTTLDDASDIHDIGVRLIATWSNTITPTTVVFDSISVD